jgi:hypothetical protein
VMKVEASEASSSAPASSFGSPMRPMGVWFFTRAKRGGKAKLDSVISLGNQPGAMALTLTPRSAQYKPACA